MPDLKALGLCLAGGAASGLALCADFAALCNDHTEWFGDYDLFVVGGSDEAAVARSINAVARALHAAWGPGMRVHRSHRCTTFVHAAPACASAAQRPWARRLQVQVIHRRYESAGAVVCDFDLGSSAFAWDGDRLWLSAFGLIAANWGANVVNLALRRGRSYESRLRRYFHRGFDLVAPGLDVRRFGDVAPEGAVAPDDADAALGCLAMHGPLRVAEFLIRASLAEVFAPPEGTDGSDYSPHTVSHFMDCAELERDMHARLLRAHIAAAQPDAEPHAMRALSAGLTAAAPYADGLDVTQIVLAISEDQLMAECVRVATGGGRGLPRICTLLALSLPEQFALAGCLIAAQRDTRAAELRQVLRLPVARLLVAVQAFIDATLPPGALHCDAPAMVPDRVTMSPDRWYGEYHRRASP